MIKIYKLNNELAGWIDLDKSEFDNLGTEIQQNGSFELDITLADNETLANIDVVNETADVVIVAQPTEEEILASQARQQRDRLLVELDSIISNPLRWNSMTQEQQDDYALYRLELLDVPQQDGFPTEINWPTKPV